MSARVEFLAYMLQTSEQPFLQWSEISGNEQDAYLKKARRVLQLFRQNQPAKLEACFGAMAQELTRRG